MTTQQMYVDLDDLENPLKPLYQEPIHHNLIKDFGYYYHSFNVERNELELDDDWWDVLSSPSKVRFNSLKYIGFQKDEISNRRSILSCAIVLGEQTNQFGRKVLNFLEVTGIVGGIFEIWDIVFGSFIGFAYSYMFKRELK